MALITYFILIKGVKAASFITPEMSEWIKTHLFLMLGAIFLVSAVIFEILILLFRINILKIIVLVGTFALAIGLCIK